MGNAGVTRDRRGREQRAWRAANALRQLLDRSCEETRGMVGFGKPNLTRAGAAPTRT